MKHSSSRAFFAYWNAKRGDARAPDRSEFEPSAVRELLSDIFVLSYDAETRFPFRVAGTRTSALLGCDLKNRSFSALFTGASRGEIEDIITCVAEETLPAIAGVTATDRERRRRRISNCCCCRSPPASICRRASPGCSPRSRTTPPGCTTWC